MRNWVWLAIFAVAATGQTREANPYRSPKDVAEGRRLYSLFCVFCHGMDGASGRGARLASTFRRHGASDRDQYRVIANGISGTEMSGHFLEEDEIWKILAFVRTLEASASGGGACAPVPGNAASGAALFSGKGGCTGCHAVTSKGRTIGNGRLGPDLTLAGSTRTRAHLRESLTDPGRSVAPAFRQARVVTNAGAEYRGFLLNEDEYTLHLLDFSEEIRSVKKAGLRTKEYPSGSTMPSYADRLTAAEIDDVVSYLCGLQGGSR